jgi:protein O-GlcNAc transferase
LALELLTGPLIGGRVLTTISKAMATARQHEQEGRLDLAEEVCRQILAVEPDHAGARDLLQVIARQPRVPAAGRRAVDTAEQITRQSIALAQEGKLDEAIAGFRRAVEVSPGYVSAHYNLGCALRLQGKLEEAIACYRRTVQLDPRFFEACYNLGNLLREQGKLGEAAACYRRVAQIQPGHAGTYVNLGNVLKALGDYEQAVACFLRAIELRPDSVEAYSSLADARRERGQIAEAITGYRRALEIKPDSPEVYNNLGLALKELGKFDEAVACCRRALELRPDWAPMHNNLGNLLCRQEKPDEAIDAYRRALELKPDFAAAHNNLGNAMKHQGRLDEALASFRRALTLAPSDIDAHSNVLSTLQYCDGVTLRQLAEAHAEYEQRHCAPLGKTWNGHANVRDPERKLRLGLVSSDFGRHPVGYFLVRTLENLDRSQCEVVCYSDRIASDEITARLKSAVFRWHNVFGLPDHQLAGKIRDERIDILFDLAGHTAGNRLLVFARKPAPIQMTWIGYEGTTGVRSIDHLLADRHVAPAEMEAFCCEKVLRLPDGYVCYDPPDQAPPVGPLPASQTGRLTLGSFNSLTKITPAVVAAWSRILHRLPDARLVFKYQGLDRPEVQARFLRMFQTHGIGSERLELLGRSPYAEYLATYQRIDLALDSFPFNGGATTCEALWMGVPGITCPGGTFASRHSLSHLSGVGLRETIAGSLEEYVDLAVELAGDLPRLAEIRARLRPQMAASPLCDGKRFANNLLHLLRQVWRDWSNGPSMGPG